MIEECLYTGLEEDYYNSSGTLDSVLGVILTVENDPRKDKSIIDGPSRIEKDMYDIQRDLLFKL